MKLKEAWERLNLWLDINIGGKAPRYHYVKCRWVIQKFQKEHPNRSLGPAELWELIEDAPKDMMVYKRFLDEEKRLDANNRSLSPCSGNEPTEASISLAQEEN